jgi:hypothetical protein
LCKKIDSSRKEHLSLRTVKGKYFIAFLPFNNLIECGEQKQMSIFWCVMLKGKRTNVWEKEKVHQPAYLPDALCFLLSMRTFHSVLFTSR